MARVVSLTLLSQLLTTVLGLGLLGVVFGLASAAVMQRKEDGAVPKKQAKKKPDAETERQLKQLKEQLRSGLITKEEYREKRESLLKE